MGSILNAHCENCGFKRNDISFGGGMRDMGTVCNVPAINKKTKRFVVKNYNEYKFDIDSNYVFYHEPEMCNAKLKSGNIYWGDIHLSDKNNFCPKCKQFTLQFEDAACWD